jgi:tetratricopeptide (TPR) repeat protein
MHAVEMEDLKKVLDDQEEGRLSHPLGEELVCRELITRDELEAALRYQMVEEILEIFYWKDVTYEFFSGPPDKALQGRESELTRVGGPNDTSGILLHVTKFLDDMEKFNRITPSMRDVYELTADPTEFLAAEGMPAEIGDLVALIDGERDMSDVLRALRLNRFEAMELFYRLRSEGFIRPKNSFELLMLAENRREDLPPEKRAHLYERAAELGVEGFDIAFRTGQAYEEMGKKELAAERYSDHARQLQESGNLETAAMRAARAVDLCPDRTDFRRFHSTLLQMIGKTAAAVDELMNVAHLLRERGEPAAAEAVLDEAHALDPDREDVLITQSEAIIEQGQRRRACALLLGLAADRLERKEVDSAFGVVRRAIRTRPQALRPRRVLSRYLEEGGDKPGAAGAVAELVPVALERTEGRPERAKRLLRLLLARIEGLDMMGHAAVSDIAEGLIGLGEKEEGLALLITTGERRIAQGQLQDALEAFQRAVELRPEDLDLAETLALLHARLGAREHAIARLRGIAGLYWKRGKLDRAEKALREILRLDPFSPDALLEMSRLRADQGRTQEAAEGFTRIGHLYRSAGDLEAAVTYFDEACRLDPSRPEYVRALADSLARTLKMERALDSFDALLAMLRARGDHTGVVDISLQILKAKPDHREAGRALVDALDSLSRRAQVFVGGA